ncbi:MAG TPA: type-F conjugative transfer system secretin TraK [Legionella sp.]|nr:type-F conjugative transfer system secretin TraK [Legionella sp.]
MKKIIPIVLSLTMSTGFAAQIKTVKNYDEVAIEASITEPNTLLLHEDRIAQMKAPANTLIDICNGKPNCKLIDETTGSLTFMPSPLFHTRAFTLNLTTEKGNFYNVRITPKPISSQTILFKLLQKPNIQKKAPQPSSYEEELLNFFRHLIHGSIPEGFSQSIPKKIQLIKGRWTQLQLLSSVSNQEVKGEVFELINMTQRPIDIKESWFNWAGTKAIVVSSHHLLPHQSTRIYRISTHVH